MDKGRRGGGRKEEEDTSVDRCKGGGEERLRFGEGERKLGMTPSLGGVLKEGAASGVSTEGAGVETATKFADWEARHSRHFQVAVSNLNFGGMQPGCQTRLQGPVQKVGWTRRM